MKRIAIFICVILAFSFCVILSSCGENTSNNSTYTSTNKSENNHANQNSSTAKTYTITWKNYNGDILKTDTLAYGAIPNYNGTTPTKPANSQYTYTFSGWSPSVSKVDGNTTYSAQFRSDTKTYTITWKNYNGDILKTDTLAYGAIPNYNGTTPTKPANSQYTYTFSGWSPSVGKVSENATYVAEYTSVAQYTYMALNTSTLLLSVGQKYTFDCRYLPSNAPGEINYSTTTNGLLKVDNNKIEALKPGTTDFIAETNNGIRSKCKIYIYDFKTESVPMTFNNWSDPSYFITETVDISSIKFWVAPKTSGYLTIRYAITANKTYCMYSGSYAIKYGYKIYDSTNNVVKSGTITSTRFAVGETTTTQGGIDIGNIDYYDSLKDGGEFKITLQEVRW